MSGKPMNPVLKYLVPVLILLLGIGTLTVISSHHASSTKQREQNSEIHNNAAADTSVETLKTLTAEVSTVQEQNRKVVAYNEELNKQLKSRDQEIKSSVLEELRAEFETYKTQLQAIKPADTQNSNKTDTEYMVEESLPVTSDKSSGFIWVSDLQHSGSLQAASDNTSKVTRLDSLLNPGVQPGGNDQNYLSDPAQLTHKPVSKPYFTIPVNATLTGAVAMQPLVGRIPINGKVPDPYTFKVVIGPHNLAANGVDIPSDIHGIVASGITTGDMLGSCARGDITSMTFVFGDGRISTTEAEKGQSLGTIAAANGNPCIAGEFHSNAALYLGVTTGLGGIQGYANALSQAQTSTSIVPGTGAAISTIIKNGNTYAMGQAGASAASAAQRWWDQRVQNSFDFVFVPNVDPETNQKLVLNINITKEIEINYNPQGRKIAYEHFMQDHAVADFD